MATDALPGRSTALGPTHPHRLVIGPLPEAGGCGIDAEWGGPAGERRAARLIDGSEPGGNQLDAVVRGDPDPDCP